jgi:hypothetical protein
MKLLPSWNVGNDLFFLNELVNEWMNEWMNEW